MNKEKHYILTISSPDKIGIVAAVTNFISENKGFICQSSQFGDPETNLFFMRLVFRISNFDENLFAKKFDYISEKFLISWKLHDMNIKPKVLIMVSKEGHCLNHILYKHQASMLDVDIVGIISNHNDLKKMAKIYGIKYTYLPVNEQNRVVQEKKIQKIMEKEKVDLLVLARYMQIFSGNMCAFLKNKAINIHHSFLPSFKGAKPYHQAYKYGVKLIGATAHYVTEDLDMGPVIEQEVSNVTHNDNISDLIAIGGDIEARVLTRAIKFHVEGRILLNGNKTIIFK